MTTKTEPCACRQLDEAAFEAEEKRYAIGYYSVALSNKVSLRSIEAAAIVEAAIALIKAYKEKSDVEGRQRDVLQAIQRAKQEIIDTLINLRLNELKGEVEGLINNYQIITQASPEFVLSFISDANKAEGNIRVFNERNELATADKLAPLYIVTVSLRAVACTARFGDSNAYYTTQAITNLKSLVTALEKTVLCRVWSEPGTPTARHWMCSSTYTGIRNDDVSSPERGTEIVLSTTNYANANGAIDRLKNLQRT